MKVGIPTMGDSGLDESVSQHFGRASTFTIVDTKAGASAQARGELLPRKDWGNDLG